MKTGFIFGNNALSTYGDVKKVYETLMALEYLVVADLYLTPTAELADLVLPVASWAEVDALPAVPFYGQNVIMAQQKTVQFAECMQDEEIMVEICRRLDTEFGQESPQEVYDTMLRSSLDFGWEELKKMGSGADVVSIGELLKATKAGINPKKIVFSGIGKTEEEIKMAIKKDVLLINVESVSYTHLTLPTISRV